jgi:hypothetical protein
MKRAKLDLRPRTASRPEDVPPATGAGGDTRTASASIGSVLSSRAGAAARPRSREGTKLIGAHVPLATAKRLARLAVDVDKSQQELVEEALTDLFAKYKA